MPIYSMTLMLTGIFIVSHLDYPLIILHNLDGADLENRNDGSLDLVEEEYFLRDIYRDHVLCF